MNTRKGIVWVTGLPGSGKSFFADKLKKTCEQKRIACVVLDGDEMRRVLGSTFGYSKQDRLNIAKIYVDLAHLLYKQGIFVIVSTVSMFDEVYKYLDSVIPFRLTVFVNASNQLLDSRNKKGLRSQFALNSPGRDLKVDTPNSIDFSISGEESAQEITFVCNSIIDRI